MVRHTLFPALALAAGVNLPSMALGLSPSEAVAIATEALLQARVSDAQPIPPSRGLPDCSGEVSAEPTQGRWSTITLRCDADGWTRALRTRSASLAGLDGLSARNDGDGNAGSVEVFGLARPLGKGATIGPGDLVVVRASAVGPDQVFTRAEDLVGRRVERALAAGRPILARHLEPDWIVTAGQPVTILSESGGIRIAMTGQALGDGAYGDLVEVVNQSSGRKVAARVVAQDIVHVALKPSGLSP